MALSPNVVVVAAGDLITAAHLNNIRSNLDRLDTTKVLKAGDTMSGDLVVGGNPATPATGTRAWTTGTFQSYTSDTSFNVALRRGGSASVGEKFVSMARLSAGAEIGSISIATTSAVAYNTTSDPRLKHRDGDAGDAADVVQRLGRLAFPGRWLNDDGDPDGAEWVLLSSHDIEDEAPFVVTGERGAVDDNGNVVAQQVNYPGLVPMLVAALSQALDRIDALEAAAP